MSPRCYSLTLALAVLLGFAVVVRGGDWGTIRGKVVWAEEKLPQKRPIKANRDECACRGGLYDEPYVVDPDSKGVRWVLVWLLPEKDRKLPIHPEREKFAAAVEVETADCRFEPHVLGVRQGQKVVFKNSGKVDNNVCVLEPRPAPTGPPPRELVVYDWEVTGRFVPFTCGAHSWMNGYLRVFDHPYFAVTNARGEFEIKDAPAGNFRLVVWQEKAGYFAVEKGRQPREGVPITIRKDGVTEVRYELRLKKE